MTKGEGNIRKRSDGRWEERYTAAHDPRAGKPISKNVLGKTQAEVKEKLKRAIADAEKLDFSMLVSRILRQSSHIFCPTVKQKFDLVMHQHPRPFFIAIPAGSFAPVAPQSACFSGIAAILL